MTEIPGARDFVRASRLSGLRLAVASSASAPNVTLALRSLGLLDQFDAVVHSADVQRGKPAPDPYLEAARRVGVSPRDAVVFEDTTFGISSAHAAGARCVGIATTLTRDQVSEADLVLDDFLDVEPAQVIRDLGA